MKLFSGPIIIVAAAVSVNASPTLSAQKRDSPPAPSAQGPLSLKSTLQPLNTTHVNVSITNTYPEDISILYWNTHFQPDQDAAHGSFQVSTASSGGQVQVMQRGPNMAQFYFDSADTSHFYNITAGTTYSDVFDITDVFAIPQAGEYDVVMEFTTRAILFSAGVDLNAEIEAAGPFVDSFSSLEVKSDPITMQLDASPPASSSSKQKRQMTIGSCDSHLNVLPQITTARNNARDLAKYGLNSKDDGLWAEYFNDHGQTGRVAQVFQGIINYRANNNDYFITEYCDETNLDDTCVKSPRVNAYNRLGQGSSSSITFCQRWFNLPANRTCDYPSARNDDMRDQGGVFLHELTHSPALVGAPRVLDGNKCYSWTCVTGATAGTNGQPSPWTIAKSYEMYAYAARAIGTKFCTVDIHSVDNNALGGIVGG